MKLNHVDFIWPCGYFDICQFFDTSKTIYPGMVNVVNGKMAYHITVEVDCESLLSMSGYKSEPQRLNADTDTYDGTVIASHRIHHKYIRDRDILDRNISS